LGKFKISLKPAVWLKSSSLFFCSKRGGLKLVVFLPGGGGGVRMPHMYFPSIRSSFVSR